MSPPRHLAALTLVGVLVWLSGCTGRDTAARSAREPSARPAPEGYSRASAHRSLVDFENHFLLTWRGARMGEAVERVRRRGSGWRYERHERLAIKRADELVPLATHITIDMSADLRAERVDIKQISGAEHRLGRAFREPGSGRWTIEYGSEPTRTAPADAVPAELVAVLLYARPQVHDRGDVAWRGPVLMPGHGFAVADMSVVATDPGAFAVSIVSEPMAGALGDDRPRLRGRWRLTRYGSLARADDDNGVSAVRVHPRELAAPFAAPEMVVAAGIPVRGMRPDDDARLALRIAPVERAGVPPLPGQRVHIRGQTWTVEMYEPAVGLSESHGTAQIDGAFGQPDGSPPEPQFRELARRIVAAARGRTDDFDRRSEVAALVRATDRLLADDLGTAATEARSALALGRGDCTAHATLFYELARARGVAARLVTGYRLDGDRLIRHRWALAEIDGAWLAVDPTHGEMPARARLIGLAVHGPSAAELALVDETVFAGFAGAVAHWDDAARL